jgi:hypothetical protein
MYLWCLSIPEVSVVIMRILRELGGEQRGVNRHTVPHQKGDNLPGVHCISIGQSGVENLACKPLLHLVDLAAAVCGYGLHREETLSIFFVVIPTIQHMHESFLIVNIQLLTGIQLATAVPMSGGKADPRFTPGINQMRCFCLAIARGFSAMERRLKPRRLIA